MNRVIINKNEIINLLGHNGKFANVFSDKIGIINALMERMELRKYGLYMFQSLSADMRKLTGVPKDISSGGLGIDFDKEKALSSCFGEALERYCMSFAPQGSIIYARMTDFPPKMINCDFGLYDEMEYKIAGNKFLKPQEDIISWIKIKKINHPEDEIYWPAGLVYLPYPESIAETTSTGIAAAENLNDAINSGLLEVLERDAMMMNFHYSVKMDSIILSSLDGEAKVLLDKILKKYNVKVYKLKNDIELPIYYSLIWTGKGKNIHFGIGASASIDSNTAVIKSLKECLFTYFYSKNIMDLKIDKSDQIEALYEHFLYYQGEKFYDLLRDGSNVEYTRQLTTHKEIINALEKKGYSAYYIDLTTKDIYCTGIKVVRVVVPGYVDLNKTHLLPRKNSNRYVEFAREIGLTVNKLDFTNPHPFP